MDPTDLLPDDLVDPKTHKLQWVPLGIRLVMTLVGIAVVLGIRAWFAQAIRSQPKLEQEVRRRWLVQLRNGTILFLVLSIIIVWAEELRAVAVYVLAVAVATVIATKELIQCIMGGISRTLTGSFRIGDRIEIGKYRGDVYDYTLLTTTLLEIGPNEMTHRMTGRAVVIPNSQFLTGSVINESFTHEHVLHVFAVPMKLDDDWELAEQILIEAAKEHSAPYLEAARKHFQHLTQKEGLSALSVEPRTTFNVPSAGTVEIVVRLAVPAKQKGKIEQAILRSYLTKMKEQNLLKKAEEEKKKKEPTVEEPPHQGV